MEFKKQGTVHAGKSNDKPDAVLNMSEGTFMAMANGSLNGQKAFMAGKLKIKGSMGLAMKLQPILDAVLQVKSSL